MKTACFTGHRDLDCDLEDLKFRVYDALERMIKNAGITDFYNGGAVGWDMLTAQEVLNYIWFFPVLRRVSPINGQQNRKRLIFLFWNKLILLNKSQTAILMAV